MHDDVVDGVDGVDGVDEGDNAMVTGASKERKGEEERRNEQQQRTNEEGKIGILSQSMQWMLEG